MGSRYEFWLTDDAGRRIALLNNFAYVSFSRTSRGYGTILFGTPMKSFLQSVPSVFQPDWRIDCWRSPEHGFALRREGSFLLRKYSVYDRTEDQVRMISFWGRSPIDILRRWAVSISTVSEYTKTDYIDDMMKAVVTDNFITTPNVAPVGEFLVEGDLSLGPSISQSFPGKNVLDVLTDLKATSFSLNAVDPTKRRIFFDVVEGLETTNGFGYIFRTYADLRGIDRTNKTVFSIENGNLKGPEYIEDYLDQITKAKVNSVVVTGSDNLLSRWNNILQYQYSSSSDTNDNTSTANKMLSEIGKKISLNTQFLSTPGSPQQPRSLYGIDWDLGDLLPVQYAGINMTAEVEIVWVSINDSGEENIVGSNKVGI